VSVPASSPETPIERYGRYYLFEKVGKGGMAEVWKAVGHGPQGFRRVCVVKRILPELLDEPSFITMFIDEAKISSALHHPNIAQILEFGEINGVFFLALEYLHGRNLLRTLAGLRARKEAFPDGVAAYIAQQVALGLDYAHRLTDSAGSPLGIVHRDITPANVMLLATGGVKILDFGIVKAAAMVRQSITEAGVIKGKKAYLSPEQITCGALDGRTDVFALGVVLWEMLTCRHLFLAENDAATARRILEMPIPPPSERRPGIHPDLDAITLRALARDPADRFPSAGVMAEALEQYLLGVRYTSQALPLLLRDLFGDQLAGPAEKGIPDDLLEALEANATPLPGLRARVRRPTPPDPEEVVTSSLKATPTPVVARDPPRAASQRRRTLAAAAVIGVAAVVVVVATAALRPPPPPPSAEASPAPPTAAVAPPAVASAAAVPAPAATPSGGSVPASTTATTAPSTEAIDTADAPLRQARPRPVARTGRKEGRESRARATAAAVAAPANRHGKIKAAVPVDPFQ